MNKEFVTYEQTLALKELGFDEPCIGYYYNGKIHFNSPGVNLTGPSGEQPLPLKQQAFRWFREKYNLEHELCSLQKNSWLITIRDTSSTTELGVYNGKQWNCDDLDENIPQTYEEAEQACLDKLIEIVRNE
jgi:hypothetical protein